MNLKKFARNFMNLLFADFINLLVSDTNEVIANNLHIWGERCGAFIGILLVIITAFITFAILFCKPKIE